MSLSYDPGDPGNLYPSDGEVLPGDPGGGLPAASIDPPAQFDPASKANVNGSNVGANSAEWRLAIGVSNIGDLLRKYRIRVPVRNFGDGFSNKGGTNQVLEVTTDGLSVHIDGLVVAGTLPAGVHTAWTMPNGFAPTSDVISNPSCRDSSPAYFSAALDMTADGGVLLIKDGTHTIDWIGPNVSYPNPSNFLGVLGHTIGSDDISVMIPKLAHGENYAGICMYFHGSGNDQLSHITAAVASGSSTQVLMKGTVQALLNAKWIILSSKGASVDHWGNPASFAATQAALSWAKSTLGVSNVAVLGQSMGALSALRALTQISGITKFYGIFPVTNLGYMHGTTFASLINTAYGGNYEVNSVGCDPMLFTTSAYAGKKLRMTASSGDTVVSRTNNADALVTKVASVASSSVVVNASGDHGDPSAFVPSDIVTFFNS